MRSKESQPKVEMTQNTLDLMPESRGDRTSNGRVVAQSLVFLGLQVTWRRSIGDLSFNTDLAQVWEAAFDHWTVEDRVVHMVQSALGYGIELSDGRARFILQEPNVSLPLAHRHVVDLMKALHKCARRSVSIHCEAQYLEPVMEADYPSLNAEMGKRMLNQDFAIALGLNLLEVQYLVDAEYEGQWCQIKAGPIRAEQIPSFVESRRLPQIPEMARFYSVSSRASGDSTDFDLDEFLGRVFRLGKSVSQELKR